MPRPLWLFSLVNQVIGIGAFVCGGILAPLAHDLGIGVPVAGQAMTAHALSTALPAPMVLLAWAGVPFAAAGLVLPGFGHTSRPSATATQERAA